MSSDTLHCHLTSVSLLLHDDRVIYSLSVWRQVMRKVNPEEELLWWTGVKNGCMHELGFVCSNAEVGFVKCIFPAQPSVTDRTYERRGQWRRPSLSDQEGIGSSVYRRRVGSLNSNAGRKLSQCNPEWSENRLISRVHLSQALHNRWRIIPVHSSDDTLK